MPNFFLLYLFTDNTKFFCGWISLIITKYGKTRSHLITRNDTFEPSGAGEDLVPESTSEGTKNDKKA